MSIRKSSSVRFYTTPSPEYADDSIAAFETQHEGIKVAFDHDHAASFFARVLKELSDGDCPADVMLLNRQQAEALKQRDLLQPYRSPEARTFPERAQDADGFATQVFMVPFSLAYHTGKLSRDEVPMTYDALLAPRWRNQLLFPEPRLSGSGSGWYAIMKDEMGEGFLRALAGQNLICRQRAEDRLAAGEGVILIAAMIDRIETLKLKGAPVEWIPMPVMMVAGPHAVLFRDAPNPDAGKLLIDFFLSETGQTIMSRYHIPNRPGIKMRDPMFAGELERLQGCRFRTFSAAHGRDYEMNQKRCVELFARGD
ncbi:MAG TPA: ABC transporter substrate-binding protein [Candidatus Limnocylindrales bacterium]|nr:ABC transporter substrate-binding protein [Candidatus Limnocylindrales bacterium]